MYGRTSILAKRTRGGGKWCVPLLRLRRLRLLLAVGSLPRLLVA